ncbi:lipopolysaccharide kinase InaA family protein [Natronoflexus pectinivorans]|uniref:Lipopolysaccharide kinase (Kdo/WaaP) family protein n=1 Tax=Natronoflexus pectinivorans TaxID=682526 RepID=A0A4R2GI12_9BACT|nr:lipopolysaccharide kinase InaA family protein [Natronoflexus pectinivorans]TCO07913.1 lipopolysaccharide kinase (Kdo/WaaP) family protein [Natronoflexus pectinivorans]
MYKIDKKINASFGFLRWFVETIPEIFDDHPVVIKNHRNVVKVFKVGDIQLVVKYYKKLTLANRIIYKLFRKSKAERSYEYALKLTEMGVTTPMPVGYIDLYEGIFLKQSYFVSLYVRCKPVKELFSTASTESEKGLSDFARFTYDLHRKGIFHGDFSLKNVLYYPIPDGYGFCLIDINRLRFRDYSRNIAIHNLRMLDLPMDMLASLMVEYSQIDQSDAYLTTGHLLFFKWCRRVISSIKRRLKSIIRIK